MRPEILSKISTFQSVKDSEKEVLGKSEEVIVVLCTLGAKDVIAFGYAIPSLEIFSLISDSDSLFIPMDNQIYIRSIFVDPAFRRKKIGMFIRQMLVDAAKECGFIYGASHVRRVFNWHMTAKAFYKPEEVRVVKNFWPDNHEADASFMSFKL